ncbi:hypothetical protein GYMLUDRAFT_263047 [Collybiopsis luxurians FD-317 M1]|uniref:E2 ubiquitin-conjugating enzyme n=1 Tax=Collybiopsis luxurians FD-317 M1 TaxID=944289 RepID=A0A0D0B2Z9_9AGAR|nr:hypothetical protein GYMLUDRAFT_263047 [Collybiopsis luxurians FD-317 M1]
MTITWYAKPDLLTDPPPSLDISILINAFIGPIEQAWFTRRLYIFSKNLWLTAICCLLSFSRLVVCIVFSIAALQRLDIVVFELKYWWILTVIVVLGSINDLILACSLGWYLYKHKKRSLKRVAKILDRLIIWAVETSAITTIATLAMMICDFTGELTIRDKMSITPQALRRLMREISELKKSPPEGIRIQDNDDDSNILDVVGIIEGPEGTPYAGGYFRVKFLFTPEFPASPPKCTMITKIFHPNVSSSGEICVNTLKRDWKSTYGIEHILVTVKCLLIYPNPESALDEEAGKLLLEDYQAYASRARLITSVHATPRGRRKPAEFDVPSREDGKEADSSPSSSTSTPSAPTPTSAQTSSASTSSISSSPSHLTPPIVTASPKSPSSTTTSSVTIPLTSSPSSKKDISTPLRHVSPSPLATADANIENSNDKSLNGKNGNGGGMEKDKKLGIINGGGNGNSIATGANKAVKRAATAGGVTNAEKRKKALKRL